jgi:hypothetical protein
MSDLKINKFYWIDMLGERLVAEYTDENCWNIPGMSDQIETDDIEVIEEVSECKQGASYGQALHIAYVIVCCRNCGYEKEIEKNKDAYYPENTHRLTTASCLKCETKPIDVRYFNKEGNKL